MAHITPPVPLQHYEVQGRQLKDEPLEGKKYQISEALSVGFLSLVRVSGERRIGHTYYYKGLHTVDTRNPA